MRDFDNTTFFVNGIAGLLIQTVLSGLCYLVSSVGARVLLSVPKDIYIARLLVMVGFVVVWWSYFQITAHADIGNGLDPDFWYGVAWHLGKDIGALMIFAWLIIAVIDRPKAKRAA
jgi:hypothetical protein